MSDQECSTECDHYYIENGEDNGLKSVICNRCWHGMNIDPKNVVKDGEIKWLN